MEETISFQILCKQNNIIIDRFHICTWEIGSNKPIIEIGIDINKECLKNLSCIDFSMYTPWKILECSDLFKEIKKEENARFIFNESIKGQKNLNDNSEFGVVHSFSNDTKLCILPVILNSSQSLVNLSIDLSHFNQEYLNENIYVRFYFIPDVSNISIHKTGIAKSTIIYDTKINEKRNIPSNLLQEIAKLNYPKINTCYNFNIVQNNFEITYEDKHLRSIRNLEYKSFTDYFKELINANKLKIENKELLVVFSKSQESDSTYSYFTIYTKEHFGLKQISIVLVLNLICSFLFFLPSYRGKFYDHKDSFINNILSLPIELIIIFLIIVGSVIYIWNPKNILKI